MREQNRGKYEQNRGKYEQNRAVNKIVPVNKIGAVQHAFTRSSLLR